MKTATAIHYAFVVLACSSLTNLAATGLGRFSYSLLLPPMKDSLELSYSDTGWLATANLVGYMAFALIAGALASTRGLRLVSSMGLFVEALGLWITGASGGFGPALLGRIVSGVGSAGCNVPAMASMSSWFALRRRGMATGIVLAGSGVGTVLVGWMVPTLILAYGADPGWRYSWYVLAGATALIGVVVLAFSRNRPGDKGLRPFGEDAIDAVRVDAHQVRSERSRLVAVYKLKSLWHLGGVYATWGFAYIIFATFFAAYLSKERGFSDVHVGTLWAVVGMLSAVGGFGWGWVADAVGRSFSLVAVLVIQAASFATFALSSDPLVLQIATVAYGLTGGGVPAIVATVAGDITGPKLASAALGFMVLLFGIGQAIGPIVGGYVADASGSFVWAYAMATAVGSVGILAALLFGRARRGTVAQSS